MSKKQKYYVVWVGKKPGIYTSWEKCKENIEKVPNAKYKSFESEQQALSAFKDPYYDYVKLSQKQTSLSQEKPLLPQEGLFNQLPIIDSLCVDAACSGNPGVMEYRGVYLKTGKTIFYYRHPYGTNNIGEFLAIVHGLSYLKKHELKQPLYSDSVNAIKWVSQKVCKTKLPLTNKTKDLFEYIHRAEHWLRTNSYSTQILKWDTEHWKDIPADFGRK